MSSDTQPLSIGKRLRQGKGKIKDKLSRFRLRATSPSPSQSTSAQTRPASRCRDRSPATRPPSIGPSLAPQAPASTATVSDSWRNPEIRTTSTDKVRPWYEKQWTTGYDLALKRLSDAQRKQLEDYNDGSIAAVTEAAKVVKEEAYANRWKPEWKGRAMVVVEQMEKILRKVDKYACIVDIAIQHSPEITALVWGGVRFLLMVGRISFFTNMLTRWKGRSRQFQCKARSRARRRQNHNYDERMRVLRQHLSRL